MRIALINGSPKINNSTSGTLLEDMKRYMNDKAEIIDIVFRSSAVSEEVISELEKSDIWVFSYPLYVDGIPGHLLSCLVQLEEAHIRKSQIQVYGIVNCGFYEGIQNEYSLKILQNWCLKTGFIWSGGIGVGGGGGLAMMPVLEPGYDPKAPIDKALAELSDAVLKKQVRENVYVNVALPRFLYKMGAEIGWRRMIKANVGKARDLKKRWD